MYYKLFQQAYIIIVSSLCEGIKYMIVIQHQYYAH